MKSFDLYTSEYKDEKNSSILTMKFFLEGDIMNSCVGEIVYVPHMTRIIRVTKMYTTNLVENKIGPYSKNNRGLGIACFAKFIEEIRKKESNKINRIILLSVPSALGFYRKAANRLLENQSITSWRQGYRVVPLNKVPLTLFQFGSIEDHVFQFTIQ